MPPEVDAPGSEDSATEARVAFLLRLRERGIRDLAVLRAMEAVPRAAFVADRYAPLATRDVALPIGCGQTAPEPFFVARVLAGSLLDKHMRVLVIGLGSGYATAVLAHLVREVVAVERFRTLVNAATSRFLSLGLDNIAVRWADGAETLGFDRFDRIVIFAVADPLPDLLWTQVERGGAILFARPDLEGLGQRPRQVMVRAQRPVDGMTKELVIGPSRLLPLRSGLSQQL